MKEKDTFEEFKKDFLEQEPETINSIHYLNDNKSNDNYKRLGIEKFDKVRYKDIKVLSDSKGNKFIHLVDTVETETRKGKKKKDIPKIMSIEDFFKDIKFHYDAWEKTIKNKETFSKKLCFKF